MLFYCKIMFYTQINCFNKINLLLKKNNKILTKSFMRGKIELSKEKYASKGEFVMLHKTSCQLNCIKRYT